MRRPRSSRPDGACTFAADPGCDSAQCAPIWTDVVDPAVLRTRCCPCAADAPLAFDLHSFDAIVAIATDCQHVRLSLDGDPLRLDIVEGSVLDGAVRLEPAVVLERDVDVQLSAVRRLQALLAGRTLRAHPDKRLSRLVLALRVLDARAEEASVRTIALELLDTTGWPGDGEWMKSWVRRLIWLAERLQRAGPAAVLRHKI